VARRRRRRAGDEPEHHTKDLHDSIAAGDFPQWDLHVQLMSDDEHPELDFDPLDHTETWPHELFPVRRRIGPNYQAYGVDGAEGHRPGT
jgi:catalase